MEIGAVKTPAVAGRNGAVIGQWPFHLAADILTVCRRRKVCNRSISCCNFLLHLLCLLLAGSKVALILLFQKADVLDLCACRRNLFAQGRFIFFQRLVCLLQLLLLVFELGFLFLQLLLFHRKLGDDVLIAVGNLGDDTGAHQAVIVAVCTQYNRQRIAVSGFVGGQDTLAQQANLLVDALFGGGDVLLRHLNGFVHRLNL